MEAQDRLSAAGLTADHVAPLRDEPPTELRRVPGCRSKRDRQVVLTYDSHRVLDHYKWVTLSGRAVVLQEAWPQTRGDRRRPPFRKIVRLGRRGPRSAFHAVGSRSRAGGRSHRRPVPRRGDDGRGCARIDVRLLRLRHRRVRPGRRSDRAAAGARGAPPSSRSCCSRATTRRRRRRRPRWDHADDVVELPVRKRALRTRIGNLVERRHTSLRLAARERKLADTVDDLRLKERAMNEAPVGITIAESGDDGNPIVYARVRGAHRLRLGGVRPGLPVPAGRGDEPETRATLREAIDDDERPASVDILNYRCNGQQFWNRLTVAPISDADGEVTHYVGFQTDITDRKIRERRLEVMNRVLDHNLRNKMNLLAGYADLLRSDLDDPDALKSVEVIAETTDDLMRIATAGRKIDHTLSAPRRRRRAPGCAAGSRNSRAGCAIGTPRRRSPSHSPRTTRSTRRSSGCRRRSRREWRTRSNTTTARTPPWTFASSDDRRVARGRDHRQRSRHSRPRDPESSTAVRRR